MRWFVAAVVAFGLLASSGCASFGTGADRCSFPASASDAFPSTTLEDWVTYGDHAAVVRGVDELDQNGREVVRLRWERTLWSRPQAPAPAPAETFSSNSRSYNSAAAEPDHQYLLVGAWWDAQQNGQPSYVHLELLAFDDGVVGRGSAGCKPRPADKDTGRAALWGQGEPAVVDLLNRTPADPEASKFMAIGPDARWQRVAADR